MKKLFRGNPGDGQTSANSQSQTQYFQMTPQGTATLNDGQRPPTTSGDTAHQSTTVTCAGDQWAEFLYAQRLAGLSTENLEAQHQRTVEARRTVDRLQNTVNFMQNRLDPIFCSTLAVWAVRTRRCSIS